MSALPPVGSVWREHDNRFERFVKVIGWQDMRGDARVIIQTITASDGRAVTGRATRANPAAFGKRYRAVPALSASLAADDTTGPRDAIKPLPTNNTGGA